MTELVQICPAVAYWLNYKNLTGLTGLFSEASLTVPIAEYLKTRHVHSLQPEVNHPSFERIRGRPRQIDFVAMNANDRWTFVIEAKFFPTTIQQVVNDVGRLLVLDKERCERFLVIAGPAGDDRKSTFRINMIIGGKYKNVIARFFAHYKTHKKIIKLRDQPYKIRMLFYNFLRDYRLSKMPNAFEITCVDFHRSRKFAVGLWRVGLRRGTGQIGKKALAKKRA